MKAGNLCVCVLAVLCFLISASCEDKKKEGDFSGVSNLIADRNKARFDKTGRPLPEKKHTSKKETSSEKSRQKSKSKKEELTSIVLYKEDVKILGSKSGKTLAKGIAYINKQGEIVKLKIVKK